MNLNTPAQQTTRRDFLRQTSKLGLLCGFACMCPHTGMRLLAEEGTDVPVPDPKKLNYCGYTCPGECQMKLAGLSGDVEKKREAYEKWRLKERYGLEFDPDKVLCNGCKTDEKELGMAVSNCPVRKCAIEKKLDGCIECEELKTCEKVLWTEFPDFHKYVINLQRAYLGA